VKVVLLGWNDSAFLPRVIRSIQNQTVETNIIYVDDESSDGSVGVAEDLGVESIVKLKRGKRVYGGFPILAKNVNAGLEHISPEDDYFMIMPSDVVIERDYVEKLLVHFRLNDRLVIASGTIAGEYANPGFPRGAGRVYRCSFWNRHVGRFPLAYLWESYPVLKAQSLGYVTANFKEARMVTLRPTRLYKPMYGYVMKELGYPRSYAWFRCLLAWVISPRVGFEMFRTYSMDIEPIFDVELVAWLRAHHRLKLAHMLIHPLNFARFVKNKMVNKVARFVKNKMVNKD